MRHSTDTSCDLLKAIEQAGFRYLIGIVINRVGKTIIKSCVVALFGLVEIALFHGYVEIIGFVILAGTAIWMLDLATKTAISVSTDFQERIWQSFKRLPRRLLSPSLLDCLDRKPKCCLLFQREADRLLLKWVEELKPGWKEGSPMTSSVKWRGMVRDIKNQLEGPVRACCTSQEEAIHMKTQSSASAQNDIETYVCKKLQEIYWKFPEKVLPSTTFRQLQRGHDSSLISPELLIDIEEELGVYLPDKIALDIDRNAKVNVLINAIIKYLPQPRKEQA